jgi:pimeloyl-ACP methyl ester carboxylesterase
MDQTRGEARPAGSSRAKWKVFMWIGLGVVIFVALAYLGVSAYAASVLTKPERNIDKVKYNPGVYGMEYEEFTFPARVDGLNIAAWYIPSKENQRVIILVHGSNNSRTNGFLDKFVEFASNLHKAGFSVMMIDLRGHGESPDVRFTFGVKERRDVLGAVDWLESRGYQAGKIGVLGYSLGAGSIIGAAAEEPDIGAVWADSLYADFKPVLEQGVPKAVGLPKILVPAVEVMVKLFYGYDITASRPIDEIGKIAPRPIFLAHCQNDGLIPISNMEQLLRAAPYAETWTIANCDVHTAEVQPEGFSEGFNNHAIGYYLNPEEYISKVIRFFDENLK